MINNSDFYQRVERTAKRGETPSKEWLESYLGSFDRLREVGAEMSPFIGEQAASQFQESAANVRRVVEDLASEVEQDRSSPGGCLGFVVEEVGLAVVST